MLILPEGGVSRKVLEGDCCGLERRVSASEPRGRKVPLNYTTGSESHMIDYTHHTPSARAI